MGRRVGHCATFSDGRRYFEENPLGTVLPGFRSPARSEVTIVLYEGYWEVAKAKGSERL